MAASSQPPIDRHAVIARHDVRYARIETAAPLSVGNGEFAFTADITGLQTLNSTYRSPPLQTMAHWAWHTVPANLVGVRPRDFREERVDVNGHVAYYDTSCDGQQALCNYLRANPHRFNLGRLFLTRSSPAAPAVDASAVGNINQTLDLWRGMLLSNFTLDGSPGRVETAVHP